MHGGIAVPVANVIIIEIRDNEPVDRGVIPAVLEHVLKDILPNQSHSSPGISVLTTDHSPRDFKEFCQRMAVPFTQVIDGFSEWYPLDRVEDSSHSTNQLVHISDMSKREAISALSQSLVSKCKVVMGAPGAPAVIIIDSLSSIFRFSTGVETLFNLRESIFQSLFDDQLYRDSSLSIVLTLHSGDLDALTCNAIQHLADTHIELLQNENKSGSRPVVLKTRKRKLSGRVQFEETRARLDWGKSQLVEVATTRQVEGSLGKQGKPPQTEKELADTLAEHGLSFRISLDSKEREMRAAAGLPYLHRDEDLADSALELHPAHLQIGDKSKPNDEDARTDEDSDSEEEDMFSEDV